MLYKIGSHDVEVVYVHDCNDHVVGGWVSSGKYASFFSAPNWINRHIFGDTIEKTTLYTIETIVKNIQNLS